MIEAWHCLEDPLMRGYADELPYCEVWLRAIQDESVGVGGSCGDDSVAECDDYRNDNATRTMYENKVSLECLPFVDASLSNFPKWQIVTKSLF